MRRTVRPVDSLFVCALGTCSWIHHPTVGRLFRSRNARIVPGNKQPSFLMLLLSWRVAAYLEAISKQPDNPTETSKNAVSS